MELIWIWLGPKELAHSSLIQRYVVRENEFIGWRFIRHAPTFPFRYDLAVDNVLDAAHFDFTHEVILFKLILEIFRIERECNMYFI